MRKLQKGEQIFKVVKKDEPEQDYILREISKAHTPKPDAFYDFMQRVITLKQNISPLKMDLENIPPKLLKYDFNQFSRKIDQLKDHPNIFIPKPIFTPRLSRS